jgi:hypothetical protein
MFSNLPIKYHSPRKVAYHKCYETDNNEAK